MAPCRSQIQSPGQRKRGYSFHTRYAMRAGLDIKVLKISTKVVEGTIIHFLKHPLRRGPQTRIPPRLTFRRQQHERSPNLPIFAMGDESHHLATLCLNR